MSNSEEEESDFEGEDEEEEDVSEYEVDDEEADDSELGEEEEEEENEENVVPTNPKIVARISPTRPVGASKTARTVIGNPTVRKELLGGVTKGSFAVKKNVRKGATKMTTGASPAAIHNKGANVRAGSTRMTKGAAPADTDKRGANVRAGSTRMTKGASAAAIDNKGASVRKVATKMTKGASPVAIDKRGASVRAGSTRMSKGASPADIDKRGTDVRAGSTRITSGPFLSNAKFKHDANVRVASSRVRKRAAEISKVKQDVSVEPESSGMTKGASRVNAKKKVAIVRALSSRMTKGASQTRLSGDRTTEKVSHANVIVPEESSREIRTRGKNRKGKLVEPVGVDKDYYIPTEDFTEELKNLADVTDEKAHEAPPPIFITREQADNINQIAAQYTPRLLRDGFLQFRIIGFENLESEWWEKIFRTFKGSGFTMDVYKSRIKVSVQQVWRVSTHLFYTCTADKVDALTELPCLKKKTLGAVQDDLEKLFGGGDNHTERMKNFWRRLYQLPVDPKRTGQPMLVPYVNVYDYVEVEKSTSRIGLNMNLLKTGLREEMDENLLNQVVDHQGITTSMTYFGFSGSFFCAHIEDASYNSYNVHGGGEPKMWCVVPPSDCEKLLGLLVKHYGEIEGLEDNDALKYYNTHCQLHHKRVLITPRLLEMWGVKFKMVEQLAGDLMVLASRGMHTGMNTGLNLNYAANGICSDFHITCGEGMEQCGHDFWIPVSGEVDENGKSKDPTVRISTEKRYRIDAKMLANLQTRSANLHYKAFPESRDRTKLENEEKNPPKPTSRSTKKNLEPHLIMKKRVDPECDLQPHKIPCVEMADVDGDSNESDSMNNSAQVNVKIEIDDQGQEDTYQSSQPTTTKKKSGSKAVVVKEESVEPLDKEPLDKEMYDIEKWKVESRQPTPEELGQPKEIDAAEIARLNIYRKSKVFKRNLHVSRWQCPKCRQIFVKKSDCVIHIGDDSQHTMYGCCQREGCAGFYSEGSGYLAHMRKHWKQDEKHGVFYDESTKTFRKASDKDTPFKGLVAELKSKIAAYVPLIPVKKNDAETAGTEDGNGAEKKSLKFNKRRAKPIDGASDSKKPKLDANQ